MFVLGTAGHIDHGKSSLIKALTGIDPDRLPEEKERGMTIDLGFAWMNLPDGNEIGLVDVPGHERFVRTMAAGAGGVNAVMLVIAADDGWMPQTQEHFDIIQLLNIRYGFVALTKIDLVEPDWTELISADIKSKLKGTFLEDAPVIPCSSETGEGIEYIRQSISLLSQQIQSAQDIGKPRLFIDRSFILTGIGAVVTGTSRGGGFSADSAVYHFPSGNKTRIRSLQSHEKKVENVGAGTRAAINLTGVDRSEIRRGDLICGFPYRLNESVYAAKITNLDNSTIALEEGRKILLIHGTTETEAILRPFADKGIKPGHNGLAIIKSLNPLAVFIGDKFILRLPTPQVTVGGGQILDILENYPRRKKLPLLVDYLSRREDNDLEQIILTELEKRLFGQIENRLFFTNYAESFIKQAINKLIEQDIIVKFENHYGLKSKIKELSAQIIKVLKNTHKKKSYQKGMTVETLAKRIKFSIPEQFILLLKHLEFENQISRTNQYYHLIGFKPALDEAMKILSDKIMTSLITAGHNYLTFDEIEKKYPNSRSAISFLKDEGNLRMFSAIFIISKDAWKEVMSFLEKRFGDAGKVSLAEFRDNFQTTRKYALPLLEYLDQIKITRRDGDFRVRGANFDERYSL